MNRLIILPTIYKRRFIRSEESSMLNICHPERNEVKSKDPLSCEDASVQDTCLSEPRRGRCPCGVHPLLLGDASTELSMTAVVGKGEIGTPHRNILIARAPSIQGDRLSMTDFDKRGDYEVQALHNQLSLCYNYNTNRKLS